MAESEHQRLTRLANLLFDAARRGDTNLLREATSGGAPPDLSNQSGDSLVMLAAYHGHAEAVEVLLQAGAQVDLMNDRAQTPLGGATFKGYPDVVRTLLRFGADPAAGSPSAITMAVMFDREDFLALFDTSRSDPAGPGNSAGPASDQRS
ncbi:MAG: ankyrin repeat domain-containing protein [Acidimicrobiales bacterium]